MIFDPMSVEVTCVTLPKDHCVQVPWQYINVCGYSDEFCKLPHTYTYTYILHTYYVHTTYRMSDRIVSYWTQFRRNNNHGLSGAYVTCIYCPLSLKINTPWNAAQCAKIVDTFVLLLYLHVWSAKSRIPPIWAPWLTTPLHWVVYKVLHIPCISVGTHMFYMDLGRVRLLYTPKHQEYLHNVYRNAWYMHIVGLKTRKVLGCPSTSPTGSTCMVLTFNPGKTCFG